MGRRWVSSFKKHVYKRTKKIVSEEKAQRNGSPLRLHVCTSLRHWRETFPTDGHPFFRVKERIPTWAIPGGGYKRLDQMQDFLCTDTNKLFLFPFF